MCRVLPYGPMLRIMGKAWYKWILTLGDLHLTAFVCRTQPGCDDGTDAGRQVLTASTLCCTSAITLPRLAKITLLLCHCQVCCKLLCVLWLDALLHCCTVEGANKAYSRYVLPRADTAGLFESTAATLIINNGRGPRSLCLWLSLSVCMLQQISGRGREGGTAGFTPANWHVHSQPPGNRAANILPLPTLWVS